MSLGGSNVGAGRGGCWGGAHYHPERRRLRSSGLVLSGATISEENQERKEEMEKGAPGGKLEKETPGRTGRWREGVSGHSEASAGSEAGSSRGGEGLWRLQASPGRGWGGKESLAPASHRERAFQHLANPTGNRQFSRARLSLPAGSRNGRCSCLGQTQAVSRPRGHPGHGCSRVLSTPGFQRGAHTHPRNTCPSLGQVPNTRWPQFPASIWRHPLGLCPFEDPPQAPCCESRSSRSPVSRPCPPGSPSYSCSLPPAAATSPARRRGPAHSTPTPSPRLCPGLPRAEAWSALGVRLVPPSGGRRSRWGRREA